MDFPLPNPEQENEIVGTILQIEANARQTAERKENLRLLKNSVFAENMPSTQALESVGL
jgi:hypothetical protein